MKKNNKIKTIVVIGILILAAIAITIIMYLNTKSTDILRGTSWSRVTDVDTEYINFHKDGTYSYYYGVGSPVDTSDLCSKYTYDEATKIIKLDCADYDVMDEIKVKSVTDTQLIIIYKNEERVFTIQK